VPLESFKSKKRIALILGNEVRGLSEGTLAKCDRVVEIPMRGKKESLNVSVAFGIAAYSILAEA
jgi:tRNA G18 (ribose-2'-O)-methylase SpoU